MGLSDAMKQKMLVPFDVFPVKTEKGVESLSGTPEHLCRHRPGNGSL